MNASTLPDSPIRAESERVGRAFDAMADEYDDLRDLWYPHLFSRLHVLLLRALRRHGRWGPRRPSALDVGCGTGLQSILLARAGASVDAFDVAGRLVECAARKQSPAALDPRRPFPGYVTPHAFVRRRALEAERLATHLRAGRKVEPARFRVADALDIPHPDASFDVVSCCGSTLSLIPDHGRALDEIARVARPGAVVVLEVEQRWNLDLLWALVDAAVGGRLGYEQDAATSWRNLAARRSEDVRITYPFETHTGEVDLDITLFAPPALRGALERRGIRVLERHGIHAVTNLLPSTVLHEASPGPATRWLFGALARVEQVVGSIGPFRSLGCSLVLVGRRT